MNNELHPYSSSHHDQEAPHIEHQKAHPANSIEANEQQDPGVDTHPNTQQHPCLPYYPHGSRLTGLGRQKASETTRYSRQQSKYTDLLTIQTKVLA